MGGWARGYPAYSLQRPPGVRFLGSALGQRVALGQVAPTLLPWFWGASGLMGEGLSAGCLPCTGWG